MSSIVLLIFIKFKDNLQNFRHMARVNPRLESRGTLSVAVKFVIGQIFFPINLYAVQGNINLKHLIVRMKNM
jgi:hypothetical protein